MAAGGRAAEHRDLLVHTPPSELAARYRAGSYPSSGSGSSCAATGTGARPRSTSVCPAGRRTRRRCSPRSRAICASPTRSRRRTGVSPGPRRGGGEDRGAGPAGGATRPVRARAAGFLLRRSRAIAGLRELPKFAWLYAFAGMRQQLLAAGAELRRRGCSRGRRHHVPRLPGGPRRRGRPRPAGRWSPPAGPSYQWELRRRSVPGLLLSDGRSRRRWRPRCQPPTDVGRHGGRGGNGDRSGPGRPRSRQRASRTGRSPGRPDHGPGLDPLFLTAAGLVTETGSPIVVGCAGGWRRLGDQALVGLGTVERLADRAPEHLTAGESGAVWLAHRTPRSTSCATTPLGATW